MKLLISIAKKITLKTLLPLVFLSTTLLSISLTHAVNEELKKPAHVQEKNTQHDEHEKHEDKANHHEHDEHEDVAVLSDEQLKTAHIELAPVGPSDISETLSFYGTVEVNAEKIQHVGARFDGTVRNVNKSVGDTVREGDVLASIESNESLKTYTITSGLNGVVAERHINAGEQIKDKTAFVIADLSSVWIEVAVFPRDADKIRVGQKVRINNPSTSISAEGEIISMAVLGTSVNQTLNARVALSNTQRQWTPGLFVNTVVLLTKKPAALAVRNEALQNHEGKQVVFVQGKEGFEPRPVQLGRTDGEFSEVLNGLTAGELYASKNSFIIKAELGKGEAEHEH